MQIGGTSSVPPLPIESVVIERIDEIGMYFLDRNWGICLTFKEKGHIILCECYKMGKCM